MKFIEEKHGDISVAKIGGRLDSAIATDFETAIMKVLNSGVSKIVVNFHDVTYIASAGLRVLLMAAKKLKANNGGIALCDMNESIFEVFEVSGFSQILPIFSDQKEAVKSLH